jgi:hypothetical protein
MEKRGQGKEKKLNFQRRTFNFQRPMKTKNNPSSAWGGASAFTVHGKPRTRS